MVSSERRAADAAKTGSPHGDAQEPGRAGGYARTGLWLILAAAFLGWMFDGMEQGLFATVARPALKDLLGAAASEAAVGQWISYIMAAFLLGAACGGVAFGWLGDRIGRVRAMGLSILVYSGFIGACCFAAHPWQLACLQFFAATGMGGEWALGVAIVVECWPDRLRPMLSGAIGSAANFGMLLIGLLAMMKPVTPDHWRWVMATCSTPALLALFIFAFLPESKRWQESARRASRDPLREIFTTRLRRLVLLGIALSSVALIGTWACATAFLPSWADQMAGHSAESKDHGRDGRRRHRREPLWTDHRREGGAPGHLLRHVRLLAGRVPVSLPPPGLLRLAVSVDGRPGGLLHGVLLRLVPALLAGTFPHARPRQRPRD